MAQQQEAPPQQQQETRFVPDEVLFAVNGSEDVAQRIAQQHRLTLMSATPVALLGVTINRYRISDGRQVPDVIHELESAQEIASIQPNYIFQLEGTETAGQGLAAAQYALATMHLTEAHQMTVGDQSLVAVIDSGIDPSHPDLVGAIGEGIDFVPDQPKTDTHGTAIASVIAAHGALTGVAPHARILAIRAFSEAQARPGAEGTTMHVVQALSWAYEHKARVVNMSFAGPYDPALEAALAEAHRRGMILIAAAGNDGPTAAPAYPAADPNVIAVTATDRDNKLFAAANHGRYIALAAPGSDIIVAGPSHGYVFSSGTSIAAAHISGLVALLLSEKPDLDADVARQVLTQTADRLGQSGQEDQFGAGLGDAARAATAVKSMPARMANVDQPQAQFPQQR